VDTSVNILSSSHMRIPIVGSGYWETRHNPPWPSYGNDFRFNVSGNGEDQAVYTFDIPVSGDYEVYAWWASHSVCSQDTPYIIQFSDGTVPIRVNQQENPGQWNFLAAGFFEQGEHQIIISDDASGTVIVADAVMIVSTSPNNGPILAFIGSKTVNEGHLLEFTVTATDPDGDNLTYSASNLPSGATFDPETHIFSWTPEYGQAGGYPNVLFTVTDDGVPPLSDSETITMGDVNRPPVLDPIGSKTVNEGQFLEFTITASDPDGDDLTFSASNLPPGAQFDSDTQVFTWTPAYGQAGSYPNVLFTVTDNGDPAMSDSEGITITVNHVEVEVIVDNTDSECTTEGTWLQSSDPYYQYYGTNFFYTFAGSGENRAIFRPVLPISGDYEIFVWGSTSPQGATNQPITINYYGGSATFQVNVRGSLSDWTWHSMGIFHFEEGTSGSVVSSNNADGIVGTDTVRWVLVEP